jgi:hypothetical protein
MFRVVLVVATAVVLAGCIRFAPPQDLPVAGGAALADVTGDGTADVLASTAGGLARYEYCGTGCLYAKAASSFNILFGSATGLSAANATPAVSSIADVGDFNGDSKLDLVRFEFIDFSFARYVVLVGDGAGGFTTSSLRVIAPQGELGSSQVEVGDIDRDGRDDLAHHQFSTNTIAFFKSTGGSITPFPPYQTITVPVSNHRISMGLRDLDPDGVVDFLLNDGVNPRTWWSGTNDGRLAAVTDRALWINTSEQMRRGSTFCGVAQAAVSRGETRPFRMRAGG